MKQDKPALLKRIVHLLLLFQVVSFLFIISCGTEDSGKRHQPASHTVDHRKPLSWGHDQKIYIFADDRVWHYAEQPLRESLERYYWTTENETYFDIQRASFQDISIHYRFKNLLFLGHLDSNQQVSKHIKERLSDQVINSVRENGAGLFSSNNLWANEQLVVFMMGTTEETLLRYNILEANTVFEMFKDKLYSYIEKRVYGFDVYRQSFFAAFPWEMKLPENFVVYKRAPDDNFIAFLSRRRDNPDRYIAVYYEDMPENIIDKDWIIKTRSRLAWDHYDEDEIGKDDIRFMNINFGDFEAVKMWGRWQNSKYAVGGAFQSFVFYEADSKKAFMVDNSVFYPEGYKLPALIEMEVISRTIEIKDTKETS